MSNLEGEEFSWFDTDQPASDDPTVELSDDSLEDVAALSKIEFDVPIGVNASLVHEIMTSQKAEIEQLEVTLDTIGIQGVDRSKTMAIHELTGGHFSSTVSLYLQRLARNQKLHGAKYLHPVNIDDLIELGEAHTISEIKADQNEKTVDILLALNFSDDIVESWYRDGGEELQSQLRLIGWLTNQPFMNDFVSKVRKDNEMDSGNILPQVLFTSAVENVTWECLRHFQNKESDYDMRVSIERTAYSMRSKAVMGVAHLSKQVLAT